MAKYDAELQDFKSIFSLDGKVAVVTGGSRGLGLHAASGLMQAGCSKVYITSRKADACDEACRVLNALPGKSSGAKAISVPADSSKVSEIERLMVEVKKTTDHVDILIANAGATWGAPLEDHDDKAFSKVMDLNVKSVFFTVQKYVWLLHPKFPTRSCHSTTGSLLQKLNFQKHRFTPLLTVRSSPEDPSRVVATASVAGLGIGSTGANSVPSYSASKAAVIHLMRHLAVDLGKKNILCNAVAPGFFPSRMASGLIEISGGVEKMKKTNPNGRIGKPDDIAGTVVYLCSRASSHSNGSVIALDGGKLWARAEL